MTQTNMICLQRLLLLAAVATWGGLVSAEAAAADETEAQIGLTTKTSSLQKLRALPLKDYKSSSGKGSSSKGSKSTKGYKEEYHHMTFDTNTTDMFDHGSSGKSSKGMMMRSKGKGYRMGRRYYKGKGKGKGITPPTTIPGPVTGDSVSFDITDQSCTGNTCDASFRLLSGRALGRDSLICPAPPPSPPPLPRDPACACALTELTDDSNSTARESGDCSCNICPDGFGTQPFSLSCAEPPPIVGQCQFVDCNGVCNGPCVGGCPAAGPDCPLCVPATTIPATTTTSKWGICFFFLLDGPILSRFHSPHIAYFFFRRLLQLPPPPLRQRPVPPC